MLSGKECFGISYLYIGVESVLKADFGPKGWDWAGRRLDIRGELGQQVQRSASATPSRASSMCSPQPDQVAFLQISQVTFEHIMWLLYRFLALILEACENQNSRSSRESFLWRYMLEIPSQAYFVYPTLFKKLSI